jgi:hypothetical protein
MTGIASAVGFSGSNSSCSSVNKDTGTKNINRKPFRRGRFIRQRKNLYQQKIKTCPHRIRRAPKTTIKFEIAEDDDFNNYPE